jgi:hypothetical protein
MMSKSPQWPDQPGQPDQTPGGRSPLERLARSQFGLSAIAIMTGVLILALLGMLALVLSSNAHGGRAQTGGTRQNDQAGTVVAAPSATAGGNGTSSGGGVGGGGSSGGGGTHPTPTPTHQDGSATPTSTSGVITGCCLTFGPTIHQVVGQSTLSGTSVGPAYASCPSGELALSGGWAIPSDPGNNLYRSQHAGTGSWAVYVKHASTVVVRTYVECLANASGATIAERLAQAAVAADGGRSAAVASCTAGEVVVGGGFAASQGDVEIFGSAMLPSGEWDVQAKNHGGSSALVNSYEECLTYKGAHSSGTAIKVPGTSVAKDTTGSATSYACPSETSVSGGGYEYNDAQGLLYQMATAGSGTTWTASLRYNGGGSGFLFPYALCLGF